MALRRRQKNRVKKTDVKSAPILKEASANNAEIHRTKIRVIGIGGGGGSIVSEIANRVKKVDFIVANTDVKSLKEAARKTKKFQFGLVSTSGLGTGMNPGLGEAAALEDKERIKKILTGQDLCIFVACLGGGTGSGSLPVFSKIAKSLGCLTYGIFTLPFEFEGEKKMEIALAALDKTKSNFHAFTILPNERIFKIIDKNTPLKKALSEINKRLGDNLEGLIEMIYLPGLINIDFADLKTVLSGSSGKLAYLNAIEIESGKIEEAVEKVISTPLYPHTIKGARGILYNIGGSRDLQLSEVANISEIIHKSVNKSAKIIFGISQDNKFKNGVRVSILATGCSLRVLSGKNNKEPVKNNMTKKKDRKPKVISSAADEQSPVVAKKPVKPISNNKMQNRKQKPKQQKRKIKPKRARKHQAKNHKQEKLISIPIQKDEAKVEVRRTALEVKKIVQEQEKEILERESAWETPAIFRKRAVS